MSDFDPAEDPTYAARHATDLIGHGEAEATLLDAFNSGRLPHAWLFSGPKGIGKATLAFRFARFVLKQKDSNSGGFSMFDEPPPNTLEVPASDPLFARVASGAADLVTIARSWDDKGKRWRKDIGVGDIRRLQPFFHSTAGEDGWRVVIVDAADEMNRNAANGLLKILEEPPKRALLLLVAHAPGSLLPTIRSRCRVLKLRPLGEADSVEVLARCLPEADADARIALARLAEGAPGRAVALHAAGGLDLYRQIVDLMGVLPRLDAVKLHGFGDKLARKGEERAWTVFTDLLGWWLARAVRAAASGVMPAPIVPGEAQALTALTERCGLDRSVEVWENVTGLIARADSVNLDKKQVVLNVFSLLERAAKGS